MSSTTPQTEIPARDKPGLEGGVAGISAISEVDAEPNRLISRGYAIHDLVDQCSIDEVAYLLLRGDLPTQSEFDDFCGRVVEQREVPREIYDLFRAMPPDRKSVV